MSTKSGNRPVNKISSDCLCDYSWCDNVIIQWIDSLDNVRVGRTIMWQRNVRVVFKNKYPTPFMTFFRIKWPLNKESLIIAYLKDVLTIINIAKPIYDNINQKERKNKLDFACHFSINEIAEILQGVIHNDCSTSERNHWLEEQIVRV